MSNNFIVMTTIQPPTEATKKFASMEGWNLIVVGDTKTPHEEYKKINCIYMSPESQEKKYKSLSDAIGWKSIQRRNIGFIEAWSMGADIVATVDDDNIPYENWGKNLLVGKEIEGNLYNTKLEVFDPLSATREKHLWHRGFPIELLSQKNEVDFAGKQKRKVLVQADLWDGDPDVDALARLTFKPNVKFDVTEPFFSNKISPFNSQNTFLDRSVLPFYAVFPHIGRMDDIWGSYILQHYFPNSVAYNSATVFQDRNVQDLITNLEKEVLGYRKTLKLLQDLKDYRSFLPDEAKKFWDLYRECYLE